MKLTNIILLILITLFGCSEMDNKVEVVPNVEWEYLGENGVTEPAIPKTGEFEDKLNESFIKLTNNWFERNGRKDGIYQIGFTIFIGKTGEIEKIKEDKKFELTTLLAQNVRPPSDTLEVFYMDPEVIKEFLPIVKHWVFVPANFAGVTVKYKKSFGAYYKIDSKASGEFELLNSYFNFPLTDVESYLVAVEEMPEPIGGMNAIAENVKYPIEAKNAGLEGRVYVKAYIDEEGNVAKSEIIRGIGGGCDEAALYAVNQVKFTPGKQRGKPVKVQISIPILFKLQ
jgi:TonB family protein